MIQDISVFFNPARCFFTENDFEEALITLNEAVTTARSHDPGLEKTQNLERAYQLALSCLILSGKKQKPDKQLCFLIAEIFLNFGQLCCQENFFIGKQILLAALNMHLYAIGVLDECIDIRDFNSLEEFKVKEKILNAVFSHIDDWIISTHQDHFLAAAFKDSFAQIDSKKRLLNFAHILYWLGYCYKHLDRYNTKTPLNDERITKLFRLCENLLLMIGDEQSKKIQAALCLNAWPFLHHRKFPNDVQGTCELYSKALTYDNSMEMQAEIARCQFYVKKAAGNNQEALSLIQQAIEVSKAFQEKKHAQKLVADIHHAYGSYFLNPENLNLDQAEKHLNMACEIANRLQAEGIHSFNFAIYDLHVSHLLLLQGKAILSREMLKRAVVVLRKQIESFSLSVAKVERLLELFNKALKKGSGTELLAEYNKERIDLQQI